MENERNSNHELMRIVTMFMIVFYHVIVHGKVIENSVGSFNVLFYRTIYFFIMVHVNSFILLTGYYQSTSKFKQSKIWKVINANLFYKLMILLIFSYFGYITLDKFILVNQLFPFETTENWYIKYYILILMISPFFNKALSSFTKGDLKRLLLVSLFIFSILPFITGGNAFESNGYCLYQFVLMYLVGAYLRRYPLKNIKIFKNMKMRNYRIMLLSVMILCTCINMILYKVSKIYTGTDMLYIQLTYNLNTYIQHYNNPIIIVQSIAYFELFSTFCIKSKIVNKVSVLMLGVYLIHDHTLMRANIYKLLNIDNGSIVSIKFLFYIILVSLFIFISCSIIEFVRQLIFKLIYNLKISKSIRNKYYNVLKKLKIDS